MHVFWSEWYFINNIILLYYLYINTGIRCVDHVEQQDKPDPSPAPACRYNSYVTHYFENECMRQVGGWVPHAI